MQQPPPSVCNFTTIRPNVHKCVKCGYEVEWVFRGEPRIVRRCRMPGVGDYLHEIIASIGGKASEGCGCESMVDKMNLWGTEGCRANRAEIVAKLQENAKKLGWWETVAMGAKLMQEPWFNPLDPAGSMVDEAIRRAEATPVSSAP